MSALYPIASASTPAPDVAGIPGKRLNLTQAVQKRLLFFCVGRVRVWMVCRDGFSGFGDISSRAGLPAGRCRCELQFGRIRASFAAKSAYAAFITAINGPMPKMFMTRLRL